MIISLLTMIRWNAINSIQKKDQNFVWVFLTIQCESMYLIRKNHVWVHLHLVNSDRIDSNDSAISMLIFQYFVTSLKVVISTKREFTRRHTECIHNVSCEVDWYLNIYCMTKIRNMKRYSVNKQNSELVFHIYLNISSKS